MISGSISAPSKMPYRKADNALHVQDPIEYPERAV